jgi:hypothetical protein
VTAVARLEQPLPLKQSSFAVAGNLVEVDQVRRLVSCETTWKAHKLSRILAGQESAKW